MAAAVGLADTFIALEERNASHESASSSADSPNWRQMARHCFASSDASERS